MANRQRQEPLMVNTVLKPGRYTIEAQTQVSPATSASVTAAVEGQNKPLGVDTLQVRGVGKDGEYALLIDVNDETGEPLKDRIVTITDLDKAAPGSFSPAADPDMWNMEQINPYRVYLTTDARGFASCNVTFGDFTHSYSVKIGKIREKKITLIGKSRSERPADPGPPPEYLPGGLFGGAFSALIGGIRERR